MVELGLAWLWFSFGSASCPSVSRASVCLRANWEYLCLPCSGPGPGIAEKLGAVVIKLLQSLR